MQYIDLTSRSDCASFGLPLDKWTTTKLECDDRTYETTCLPFDIVKEKYPNAVLCDSNVRYGSFAAVLLKDGGIRTLETYPWCSGNPQWVYAIILEDGDKLVTNHMYEYDDNDYVHTIDYAALTSANLARICSIYGFDRGHAPKLFVKAWRHSTKTIFDWLVQHGYTVAAKQYATAAIKLIFKDAKDAPEFKIDKQAV